MATYDEVMRALRNADAAGDTAAAKRLAQIADQMRQQGAQPTQASGRGAFEAAAQGAFFGLSDEMRGAVRGAKYALTGKEGGYQKGYQSGRDEARAELQAYYDAHPVAATGLTITGAVPTTVATLGAGGAGAGAMTLPKLLGLGAAEGGVAGFGSAEGGVSERLKGAATGAAIGAGTAGIMSAALPVASAGYRTGKALFSGQQGRAKNRALAKANQALKRDDRSIGEIAKSYEANQARNPKPEVLADYGGENTMDLAAAAHSVPGKGKNEMEQFLVGRQMGDKFDPEVKTGQAARVISDAEQALAGGPSKSALQTTDELIDARKAAASPLYERAFSESGPVDITPLMEHITNRLDLAKGPVRAAVERARRLLSDPEGNPEANLRSLHEAKIALDEMMDRAAQNSVGNTAKRELREIQTWLLLSMDAGSKGSYRAAREAFAGPSRSIDAVEMGRNVFKEDAEITARDIRKLSPEDREFFTVGVIQAVRDQAKGTANTGDVVRRLMGSPKLRERIGAAVPNSTDFTNFVFDLEREASMSRLFAKTRGSRTTPLKNTVEDAGENVAGGVVDAVTGNKLGLARRALKAVTGDGKLDENTAAELRKLLVNPNDPREAMAALQKYDDQLKAMMNRRRVLAEAVARTSGAQGQEVNENVDAALQRFGFR
jgi:hypothetical protein